MGASPGPARLKLALDLDKNAQQADRANARAVLDLDAPQLKGVTTIAAKPPSWPCTASISRRSGAANSPRVQAVVGAGPCLAGALGLIALLRRAMARRNSRVGDRRVARATAAESEAVGCRTRRRGGRHGRAVGGGAEGQRQFERPQRQSRAAVRISRLGSAGAEIGLSSRVSLSGNRLTFDDLDSSDSGLAAARPLVLKLDDEKNVEGEIGLDTLDLAPAFALAIGAAGHDAAEPLSSGFSKGWRGRIAFQSLRGTLPGGGELRPVSGIIRGDGQSVTFEAIKGKIGGGEANAKSRPGRPATALR